MQIENNKPEIEVLLATYNGAQHLGEFLESLAQQVGVSIDLCVSDDGSTDATLTVLERYRHRFNNLTVSDGPKNGPSDNFFSLISKAKSKYVALADQDDIWEPSHLINSIRRLGGLEGFPAMTFCSVSEFANTKEDCSAIWPSYVDLERPMIFYVENLARGCTIVLNRKALNCINTHKPNYAIMHDWWISLVACCFGQRVYVPQALVDYRQHTNNAVGAKALPRTKKRSGWRKPLRLVFYTLRLLFFVSGRQHNKLFQANAKQAKAFAKQFEGRLSATQQAALWLTRGLSIPIPLIQLTLFQILRR